MSRSNYDVLFSRMASDVLPPHLAIKDFSGVKLHPLFKPDGGWDNCKTVFGLITPQSNGKTLVVQVSDKTEKALLRDNREVALSLLQVDLNHAIELWDTHAVPHEKALENVVKL